MPETFFQVVVRYTVQSGEIDAVLALLGEMAAATRTEEANLGSNSSRAQRTRRRS